MRRVGTTPSPLKSSEISPGRVGRRSNDRARGGRARSEEQQTPLLSGGGGGRTTRRTPASADSRSGREERETTTRERGREEREMRGESRRGREERRVGNGRDEGVGVSPKRNARGSSGRRRGDESSEEDEQDTPIYPAPGHVRFSPSVKNKTSGSPYGRKTRSGRRPYSYIQSLPSEDEQSAFNKQYSRDLRKRQKRKASEEDAKEEDQREGRRSSRHRLESSSGGEELSLGARKRNLRAARKESKEEEENEENEEEDEDGAGDPTVTEASVRRSSRRRLQSEGEAGEKAD